MANITNQLLCVKVQDFAFIGRNKSFSVVFDNNKALQFDNDPIGMSDVEEVVEKEEPKKEKTPILSRINDFLSNVLKVFKITFKVALILEIIILIVMVFIKWPEIKEIIINSWEAIKTWTGTV